MDISTLSFIGFSLFVIHEFEEIIRIRPWLERYRNNPAYAKALMVRRQAAYPSTETIAIMILEEIIVICAVIMVAIYWYILPLVVALFLFHLIHLVAHIVDVIRVKHWTPGSITAALTIIPTVFIITVLIDRAPSSNPMTYGLFLMLVGLVTLSNLLLLHNLAPAIERYRKNHI